MTRYLLIVMLLTGCAGYRDGRSLVCMGWCWQIEGETQIEGKLPKQDEQANAEKK